MFQPILLLKPATPVILEYDQYLQSRDFYAPPFIAQLSGLLYISSSKPMMAAELFNVACEGRVILWHTIALNMISAGAPCAHIPAFAKQWPEVESFVRPNMLLAAQEHTGYRSHAAVWLSALSRAARMDPELGKQVLITLAIHFALSHSSLLAASFCVQRPKHDVHPATRDAVLDALLAQNPAIEELQVDAALKLIEHWLLELDSSKALRLFEKALNCAGPESPHVANRVFDVVMKFQLEMPELEVFFRKLHTLLEANQRKNHTSGVYHIYKETVSKHPSWIFDQPKSSVLVMRCLLENQAYSTIAHHLAYQFVSHQSWADNCKDSSILLAVFECGVLERNYKIIREVLKHVLNPPTTAFLRGLLRFYLSVNDVESVRQTLTMLGLSREFRASDFGEVIKQMVKIESLDKVFELINDKSLQVAKYSYIAYLSACVKKDEIDEESAEICVRKLYECYEKGYLSSQKQLEYLSMVYLNYLVKTTPLETVKKVYLSSVFDGDHQLDDMPIPQFYKSTDREYIHSMTDCFFDNVRDTRKDGFGRGFMKIPFGESNRAKANLRLFLPNRLKNLALRTIADAAKRQGNAKIGRWCLEELVRHGWSKEEILLDNSMRYSTNDRKFEDVSKLKSISFAKAYLD